MSEQITKEDQIKILEQLVDRIDLMEFERCDKAVKAWNELLLKAWERRVQCGQ